MKTERDPMEIAIELVPDAQPGTPGIMVTALRDLCVRAITARDAEHATSQAKAPPRGSWCGMESKAALAKALGRVERPKGKHINGVFRIFCSDACRSARSHVGDAEHASQPTHGEREADTHGYKPYPKDWPKQFNGSTEACDMVIGPCACGACHVEGDIVDPRQAVGEREAGRQGNCEPWCGAHCDDPIYVRAPAVLGGNAFNIPGDSYGHNRRWCSPACRDSRLPASATPAPGDMVRREDVERERDATFVRWLESNPDSHGRRRRIAASIRDGSWLRELIALDAGKEAG